MAAKTESLIEEIKEEVKELQRDIKDLLYIAEKFAPVYQCSECNRYTREGYVCVHCGTDNS